ncbi:polygalacturonase-like [Olea europaea var. sylvestris]|uniref:polygalacturonase-like n=1 Tax=Olea europaea var. sylvestris TaxID=158386 RepID=UPI000C1CD22D|nr:polygalacturonase-like [Olea europaea var. sylvestris]
MEQKSLHEDNLSNNNYFHEESDYEFEAYPSYISTIEGLNFRNTTKIKTRFSDYSTKIRRRAASVKMMDVANFRAKGDGSTDDTKAFQDAWNEACSSTAAVTLIIPQGNNYLLKPIRFSGPCRSDITVQIAGTLVASDNPSDYSKDGRHWLVFDSVKDLMLEGGGIIHGNGSVWWKNSCKIDESKECKDAPTALTLYKCKNLVVKDLKIQNAQQIHVSFQKCKNVHASNLTISTPEGSPNTDGIHVTKTQNIEISSCTIGTGDDCISIVNGSKNVQATDITCGPGHGISIGSLGYRNSEAYVSDIVVNGAKLSRTKNGVRIKTWPGGSGSASNIKFQNVEMQNVKNPIIIDQNYCDQAKSCKEQSSAVQVKNVVYQNIKGTSGSNVAIYLDCSKSYPCQGIVFQNVDLVREGGGSLKATCNNIEYLYNLGIVSPICPQIHSHFESSIQNELKSF